MNLVLIYVGLVLAYLLAGLLYSVCYLWVYSPQKQTTELGLMVVAWPVYIVLGILLQIAYGFGRAAKVVNDKLTSARKR